jgi:phosphatidylserine decarboxylase
VESIRYQDRASGEWREEQVFGERELTLFYGSPLGKALTQRILTWAPLSEVYGLFKRLPGSRAGVRDFVERLGIDASEAELPLDAYPSLDAFFARRLRPEARPPDPDPAAFLSPCDARTLAFARWPTQRPLEIKRSRVTLPELVNEDPVLCQRFSGGGVLISRLAPADYHRFHFPAQGWASPARAFPGRLHSVHPIALEAGAPSLRNKRSLTVLETAKFGVLALIEVGALVVGTIVQTFAPGWVERGAEKGTFRFGGSTVVVLSEPGRVRWDQDLLDATAAGHETLVRVRTRVGYRATSR